MPEVPSWVESLPEVLDGIKAGDQEWFTRKDIEALLGVQPRRAQGIMSAAGAVKDGKAYLLAREYFIRYLQTVGREVLAEEERRKRKLAVKLTDMRAQFIRQPKLLVEMKNRDVAKLQRQGLDVLPEGVKLEPGRITIAGFNTGEEALQLLMSLALAISRDQAEFDKVVGKDSRKGEAV